MNRPRTVLDIDPKTFYKREPRHTAQESALPSTPPLFTDVSLADFEGIPTNSGKRSKIQPGRLETYTEVVNIGGSTGTLVHEQLGKSIVVLEGYGFLATGDAVKKLSPGDFVYLNPGVGYEVRTVDTFLVLAVSQEAYYELELFKCEDDPVLGTAPAFASRLPPRERKSKAVEQALAMASAEGRNLEEKAAEEKAANTGDFDPLDARWNGINAKPYLPEE